MRKVKRASRFLRRLPPPQDGDFDHEIDLIDHLDTDDGVGDDAENAAQARANGTLVHVEQLAPQPLTKMSNAGKRGSRNRYKDPESAIDILYENQRGLFLCGMPLFAAKALGNLDPPPWTNSVHKASPTDTRTAQVPDPSWVWAWPEWKINTDDGCDGGGWEYSFMFLNKFSWHGPTWWNSFVRRRAWIRKRVKRADPPDREGYGDDSSLGPEYFSVWPSSDSRRERSLSRTSGSKHSSRVSLAPSQPSSALAQRDHVETVEELLPRLRASAIDREKIELVSSYLEHARDDLAGLKHHMHEVMALLIFQASRRVLLSRLTEVHEQARREQDKDGGLRFSARGASLEAAVRHADEEVRRLEYWSDMKGMGAEAEGTESLR